MHKKTIKRGGKAFGPYFYTSVRTKRGRVRTHYLGTHEGRAKAKEKEILLTYRQKKQRRFDHDLLKNRRLIAPALLILIAIIAAAFLLSLPEYIVIRPTVPPVQTASLPVARVEKSLALMEQEHCQILANQTLHCSIPGELPIEYIEKSGDSWIGKGSVPPMSGTFSSDVRDGTTYLLPGECWLDNLNEWPAGYVRIGYATDIIVIEDVSVADSVTANITTENNFTHLELNDSALVLYMPFDVENTSTNTTYDYSPYNNDGTGTGVVWNSTGGYIGGAMSFDGSGDYVYADPTDQTGNFTVTFWAKASKTGQTEWYGLFSSENPIDDNSFQIDIGGVAGCANQYRYTVKDNNGDSQYVCIGTYTTDWQHVSVVWNGTTLSTYFEGVFQNSATHDYTGLIDEYIIGINRGLNNGFNGTIDEVMIFNRSLSAEEINATYYSSLHRFKTPGNQTFELQNFTQNGTIDKVNLTIEGQMHNGSSLNATLWETNISLGMDYNTEDDLVGYWTMDNYTETGVTTEIIIDSENSTPHYYENSAWSTSTYSPDYYGANYHHDGQATPNTKWGRFNVTPQLTESGVYDAWGWWISPASCVDSVSIKYMESDNDLTNGISVNQCLANESFTYYIGSFEFTLDKENLLYLYSDDDGYTISDAFKFNASTSGNAIKDHSGNKHTGQINGTTSVQGKFNDARHFDGLDDHILLSNSNDIMNNNNTWSMGAWFNAEAIGAGATDNRIIFTSRIDGALSGSSAASIYTGNTNDLRFLYFYDYNNYIEVIIDPAINLNEWYHVFVTYDGTNYRSYRNGVLMNTTPDVFVGFGSASAAIGAVSQLPLFFNGSIDEVMMFNRTLTADEIKNLYITGSTNHSHDGTGINWSLATEGEQSLTSTSGNEYRAQFTLQSTSNYVLPEVVYYAGNETTNPFYSPVLMNNITLDIYDIEGAFPDISFITPTPSNDTNISKDNYFVNVSVSEAASVVYLELTNSSGTANYTMSNDTATNFYFNVTSQSRYSTYFYVYANDSNNNLNHSLIRHVNITISAPTHSTPELNTTSSNNLTSDNVTCWNISTADAENDYTKNLFRFYMTNSSDTNVTVAEGVDPNDADLVVYYPFNSNSSDFSQQSNTGSVTGAVCNSSGRITGACHFDGSGDWVSSTGLSSISLSSVTISAWVYIRDASAVKHIAGKYRTTDNERSFRLAVVNTTSLRFQTSTTGSDYLSLDGTTSNIVNRWVHVAGTYSSSSQIKTIYIDGVLANSVGSISSINPSSTANLYIGYGEGFGQDFNGLIDEVAIWNRTLNESEVKALYLSGKFAPTGGQPYIFDSSNTSIGDNYTCEVIPFDNEDIGTAKNSTILEIRQTNYVPTHGTPTLNATSANNYTTDNVTCWNISTADSDNDNVKNIYNWYVNNSPVMVLNMPFENNGSDDGGPIDYSGMGNNGSSVIATTWNATAGIDGKGAYQFDNDAEYIKISDSASLDFADEFTLSAWAKTTVQDTYGLILYRYSSDGYYIGQWNAGSGVWLFTTFVNTAFQIAQSNSNPVVGQWTHIVGTRNASGFMTLYVDGVAQSDTETISGAIDTNADLYIGNDVGIDDHFPGTVDEVMIFNRALSAEEVWSLYQNSTNLMVSDEISTNDNWTCQITPHDGNESGIAKNSTILEILSANTTPIVSLYNYTNSSTSDNTPGIDFNVTDDDTKFTCHILLNGTGYGVNATTENATQTTIIANASLSDDDYNVTVICSDGSNQNASAEVILTVLNQVPTHGTPILNATSANNYTTDNLTCWNISTADADNSYVVNLFRFYKTNSSDNNVTVAQGVDPTDPDLVAYWPLDWNTSSNVTYDYSQFSNDGTLTYNESLDEVTGRIGDAYDFDGAGAYVDISSFSTATNELTLSAWVNSKGSVGSWRGIFGSQGWDTGYIHVQTYIQTPTNALQVAINGNNWVYSQFVFDASNLNKWVHVAVTYKKDDSLKIYINGELDNSSSSSQTTALVWNNPRIGSTYDSSRLWNGSIDEVAIWNRSLSHEEIRALYYSGKFAPTGGQPYIFDSSNTSVSDNYTCEVIPFDKDDTGTPRNSTMLEIEATANTTPLVSLYNYTNSSTADSTPGIDFNVTDDDDKFTCHILFNGTEYGVNATTENATRTTITANATLNDDDYNVTVICSDGTLQNASVEVILTVDITQITDCQELDQANTAYVLTQNITASAGSSCFFINATNVTLDANKYTISTTDNNYYCVYGSGYDNITIKNIVSVSQCDSGAVYLVNSNNSTVEDSDVGNVYTGLRIIGHDNTVDNVTASGNAENINITGDRNRVINSNITKTGGGDPFYLHGSYNTIEDNFFIHNSGTQPELNIVGASENNTILNNTFYVGSDVGIQLSSSSSHNVIENNTLDSSMVSGGIGAQYLMRILGTNNTVKNNTLNSSYVAVFFSSTSSSIIQDNYIWNCTDTSNGCIYLASSDSNVISGNTINSSASYNVFVDSNSDNNNISSTFYEATKANVYIQGGAGNRVNGTFSSSTGIEVAAANTVLLLGGNSTFTGTGINITADNVTLDGAGFNITGDGSGEDYGVYSSGYNNLTIENFGNIGNLTYGIYLDDSNNSLIQNNTMVSSFVYDASAIYAICLENSNATTIYDNVINWNMSGVGDSYGIYYKVNSGVSAGSSNISENNVTGYTYEGRLRAIYLLAEGTSNSNIISKNILDGLDGIYLHGWGGEGFDSNQITSNSFTSSTSVGQVSGIYLDLEEGGFDSNIISGNTFDLSTTYSNVYGIFLSADRSSLNTIFNNTVNVTSTSSASAFRSYGIYLYNANSTNISLVTINATAPNALAADVYLSGGSDDNNFTDMNLLGNNWSTYIANSGGIGNIFLNTSYSGGEFVGTDSELIRKWYYRAYVNDTAGNTIQSANVTAYNTSGDLVEYSTTNSSGWVNVHLTEYTNVGGTTSWYSNYTIYANKSGYINASKARNISVDHNVLSDYLTINGIPTVHSIALNTSGATNLTTQNLECWATPSDPEESTLTAYVNWWNGSQHMPGLFASKASVSNGTPTLVSTLGSGNTTNTDTWTCSVIFDDGTDNSTSWSNASMLILINLDNLAVNVATNASVYEQGEAALITVTLNNSDTEQITGNLSITIEDYDDNQVSVNYHNDTAVYAGTATTKQDVNSTTGWAGVYNITAVFSVPGYSKQESLTFTIFAEMPHSLQVRLRINNTQGTVYVPGTGELTVSSMSNATYASPTHYYLASYTSSIVKSLVFAQGTAIALVVNRSTTTEHIMEVNQYLNNSVYYLVFTEGDWNLVDKRMELIERGMFMTEIAPSFAYGLGTRYPIVLLMEYNNLDILNSPIFQQGSYRTVISNNGTISGKKSIIIGGS